MAYNITSLMTNFCLITTILSLTLSFKQNSDNNKITKYMRNAFIISLLPLIIYIDQQMDSSSSFTSTFNMISFNLLLGFEADMYCLTFFSIALYITWSIMQFSLWYMHEHNNTLFFKYLTMFLISMLFFLSANNLLQLILGWEGMGIMSFLLINWWHNRLEANSAAMQAIIYNRIGDTGLIIFMIWSALFTNSWNMKQIFILQNNSMDLWLPLLGIVLAATGKSAQFMLHPWLLSAMEGPTPVSALLHSSTMVVSGVFLLIRFYPMIKNSQMIISIILCLGAMTTLFAALCASSQTDIKKIIAFSTTSQLGLMTVTIGINQPQLAFLHMSTHAFFKALLFLCSASIIHTINNEQDIRKMGSLHLILPFTSSCTLISSLALMGMPYLSGFYSKDIILETLNMSYVNAWALLSTMLATALTSIYSTRLILLSMAMTPNINTLIFLKKDKNLFSPLIRLTLGSIIFGFIISTFFLPEKQPNFSIPFNSKILPTIMLILVSSLTLYFMNNHKFSHMPPLFFPSMSGYFPAIFHRLFSYYFLLFPKKVSSSLLDILWYETLGPKSISHNLSSSSSLFNKLSQGTINNYITIFVITILSSLLTSALYF
uniref:NADH-ubiquinone oxidoreductase chain 5 n=1 Tax=Myxine glutinosa TaxID=7769 RepID=NU5M_MYXGL|nr:NADH dehydrogenase subunit 5 [Myxine glutinosa]Q9G2W8.1 RecName: Full=NADH-ubiquinone oxidoreductase chain 5; AltName: Full=NADH dehydrogenase subunit 5 [Myxine glutinosa]CAC20659.1 NADH dehydrogenase subunit 5 [Myxine glutinosa]